MSEEQAIKMVEQQFETDKRFQLLMKHTKSDEDFKKAMLGIHARGIVLELAKKQLEEEED